MTLNVANRWTTPTLAQVRSLNRNNLVSAGIVMVPNDWPQIIADANAGLAHLNLQFIDFLSQQFLPLTATGQFLDALATTYLSNSDGTQGRKVATYASGTATMTASVVPGTILPAGTQFTALNGSSQIIFEVVSATAKAASATSFLVRSLTAGAISNLDPGTGLTLTATIPGLDNGSAVVVSLSGGADTESDDALRARILNRIRNTPMSGDANDYETWALACPGVTRAWCAANEQGYGTVTVRIMCDQLRATTDPMTTGLPWQSDLDAVQAYIETLRPVTVSEIHVVAPIPQAVNFTVANLSRNTLATQQAIETSVVTMILGRARPAQAINGTLQPAKTITAASISNAIWTAAGVRDFDLIMSDYVPTYNGNIGVLGSITYSTT